jgi:PAS domain S-box-containing protein
MTIIRQNKNGHQKAHSTHIRNAADLSAVKAPNISNLFNNPLDFSEVFDNLPIGLVVLSLDRKIIVMNQALEALTGYRQNEIRGVSCAHVLRNNICLRECPALKLVQASGPFCTNGNLINKDRRLIPVRITFAALNNIDGDMIGFLETVEDIRLLRTLDDNTKRVYNFNNIIGRSPEMKKIFQILPTLASSDSSVLITGETGTGKDMLAEIIHNASDRSKGPFVKINCGALPETLLESELFGHQKGAFTGAVDNKPGRFRIAHNGTLFLTEIGDLPLSLQAKLLTFLDDKEVLPLGSTKGFLTDVRIIAATNHDLERHVMERKFRKDLLFRLNVVRIHLPPLRDRHGDIRLLLDNFMLAASTKFGKKIIGLSQKALKILSTYTYPGNVRELRNIVEYAVQFCRNGKIKPRHLPHYLAEGEAGHWDNKSMGSPRDDLLNHPQNAISGNPADMSWSQIERRIIVNALLKAGGRKSKAAASLGWARSTLWRKMKSHNIQ